MQTLHTQFGDVSIDPSTVLTFPQGLPGFENCTQFKLLHEDHATPVVHWLQSLNDSAVMLPVVPVEVLQLNYQIELSDEECALIQLSRHEDVVLLLTLAREDGKVRVNTGSPILVNTASRLGFQKPGVVADIVFRNV
ncbi:flagellar assembly protein FliW [Chitinibacteraceae bacterium HSL-7]